jgi:urease accessory protein
MRAAAVIVAEPGRCTRLRSEPPLTFRQTPGGLYLVGTAAGPIGGDDLRLDAVVADDAALTVRSAAAQMVLPGPHGDPSRVMFEITVGERASLDWRPEPTVLVRGADHRSLTRITLGDGGRLAWQEIAVLGRNREDSGSVRIRLRVERGGSPLLCSDLALGPAWPFSSGPVSVGASRVVGTLLIVGAEPIELPTVSGVRAGACALSGDAVIVTALADSVEPVAALLDQIVGDRGLEPRTSAV